MKYYTLKDVAKLLNIQVRTAREWLKQGKIVAEKWEDNRWHVSEVEVRRLLNGHKG